MFARMLTMNVKPGQSPDVASTVDQIVVPTLRKFKNFRDEVTMLSPDCSTTVAMSFWDTTLDAERHKRNDWPHILELYRSFADGTPVLSTNDLIYSTAYQIRGRAAAV